MQRRRHELYVPAAPLQGFSPLGVASLRGHETVVRVLLSSGAAVNQATSVSGYCQIDDDRVRIHFLVSFYTSPCPSVCSPW